MGMQRWDYWNGPDAEDRRVKFAKQFKPEYQANGDDVQRRIAAVMVAFRAETGIDLPPGYASGWRPAAVNEATANAGKASTHLVAQAGDKRDDPDGAFAWWCLNHQSVLEAHGVWMEHPVATVVRSWKVAGKQGREPTPWCHLQSVPPRSHSRVYFPDVRSSGEWDEFASAGSKAGMTYAAWRALDSRASAADPPDSAQDA